MRVLVDQGYIRQRISVLFIIQKKCTCLGDMSNVGQDMRTCIITMVWEVNLHPVSFTFYRMFELVAFC